MKAVHYAGALAITYAVLAGTYIWLSSAMVSESAESVEEAGRTEIIKGLAFVGVTSLLTFAGALAMGRRIEQSAAELARRRDALVAAERRATAGLLAAAVAHDLKNVLVVLDGGIHVLGGSTGPDAREALEEMTVAVRRGATLAKRLGEAARERLPDERFQRDLVELVGESVDLVRTHARARAREITVDGKAPVMISCDPTLIHQLVTNLVMNAADASRAGQVLVRIQASETEATLEVHDDGPGVPEGDRERVFEAFFTSKPDGTGIGLFSVKAAAEAHGGRVEIDRSHLGGACFRVRLPLATG